MSDLRLRLRAEPLAVVRLEHDAPVPVWSGTGGFSSVTRTDDELSIVCDWDAVPADVSKVGPWRAFVVVGPLDFGIVGLMARLAATLADARIPLLAISTHDTDWILVRTENVEAARDAFADAGIPVHAVDHTSSG